MGRRRTDSSPMSGTTRKRRLWQRLPFRFSASSGAAPPSCYPTGPRDSDLGDRRRCAPPRAAFVASGHSKTPWIVALAVCLLILPFVNVVIAIVYLAAISPAVRRAQRALPPTSAPPSPPRWTAYPPPPPPPGWYPDPSDPTVEWYWDGSAYTNGRDNPAHSPDPGGD